VFDSPLPLVAKVELENPDGTWSHYDEFAMHDSSAGEMVVTDNVVSNLRVRLCVETNEVLCGPYESAELVEVRPVDSLISASNQPWVIGVIIFIVVVAVVAMILIVKCCCCRRDSKAAKNKTANRPTIIHGTQPPPYSFGGSENKGVDTMKDADDVKANNLYGQHYGAAPTNTGYPENTSNSNSANGGSVNSQDSLWNVKGNGMADQYIPNGYQTGGYGYDPMMHQQQQQQQPHPQQQQYEEYAHYPYPEEYLNERNRQLIMNSYRPGAGDMVDGHMSRQRIESDCKFRFNEIFCFA